ncbi:MAG: replication initiation protein [Desulfobaccales bacterium]
MNQKDQHIKRPGAKYELTLAEFPVFLLSKQEQKEIEAIEYQDQITGRDGEIVNREWRVYPNKKFGLGTESTFETFFELFQIWKENNFSSPFIHFGSLYNLLKRQGKGTGVKDYNRIVRDLNCLVGITIEAKNAFWDNEVRAYVDMTFHLFDQLELSKERAIGSANKPFCIIKASDILYATVCKNSLLITDFDRKFFQGLTPLEQRLALYLSKIFISQTIHKREIWKFASQLPIYAQHKHHVKLQLKRGCSGLLDKGFQPLKSFGFEKGADGRTEYIVFRGSRIAPPSLRKLTPKQPKLEFKSDKALEEIDYLTNQILGFCKDQQSLNFYKKVASLISRNTIFRALSEVQDAENRNETKKSRGAYFTYLVKKYAEEQGIKL